MEAWSSEELPRSPCVVSIANPAGPLLALLQEPRGQAGKAARGSTAAEPSWDRRPGRVQSSPPGVAGAEGQGVQPPTLGREGTGRRHSPPPWTGWEGQGREPRAKAGGPGGGRAGQAGAQPSQGVSICPGPAGMHQQLMESNSASTGDSHWLLRAFNPASLSSQSFMR